MHGCRNSLHCIVPPYMLRNIVENGTAEQRQQALRNLVSAEAVRIPVSYTHLDVYKRQACD